MKRILVIDDEPVILDLMRSLLVEEGYAVQVCQDACQCPGLVRQYRPDLVILDLHVPTVQHAETAIQAIRGDAAIAGTPIILCTADAETVHRRRDWLRQQQIGYLPKPFDVAQALETVAQAMSGAPALAGAAVGPASCAGDIPASARERTAGARQPGRPKGISGVSPGGGS